MSHRYGLIAVLLLLVASPALAQQTDPDQIFLTSGESIEAVVTEVLPDAVKYRRWSNRTGPVYTVAKADIHMILYANGEQEMFRTGETATSTTAAPAPAEAKASDAPEVAAEVETQDREPRKWWQAKHNTTSHTGIGLIDTGGAYPLAFIMDASSNDTVILSEAESYMIGIGGVARLFYALNAVEDFSTGTFLAGPNLMVEYRVAEQVSLFASYGVGFAFSFAQVQQESATDTSFDDVLSAGAAYWLSGRWGVHGKALIGQGDTTFTLGLSRRF